MQFQAGLWENQESWRKAKPLSDEACEPWEPSRAGKQPARVPAITSQQTLPPVILGSRVHCTSCFIKSFHIHNVIYSSHQPVRQIIEGRQTPTRGCMTCPRVHSSRMAQPRFILMSYGPKSRPFPAASKQPPCQNDLLSSPWLEQGDNTELQGPLASSEADDYGKYNFCHNFDQVGKEPNYKVSKNRGGWARLITLYKVLLKEPSKTMVPSALAAPASR